MVLRLVARRLLRQFFRSVEASIVTFEHSAQRESGCAPKDVAFAVASPKPATAVMPNLAATQVSSPNWALIRFRLAHLSARLLEPQYPCLRKPPPPPSPADFPEGLIFNVTKDCSSTRRRCSRLIRADRLKCWKIRRAYQVFGRNYQAAGGNALYLRDARSEPVSGNAHQIQRAEDEGIAECRRFTPSFPI